VSETEIAHEIQIEKEKKSVTVELKAIGPYLSSGLYDASGFFSQLVCHFFSARRKGTERREPILQPVPWMSIECCIAKIH
jgi:hypothetical protein